MGYSIDVRETSVGAVPARVLHQEVPARGYGGASSALEDLSLNGHAMLLGPRRRHMPSVCHHPLQGGSIETGRDGRIKARMWHQRFPSTYRICSIQST